MVFVTQTAIQKQSISDAVTETTTITPNIRWKPLPPEKTLNRYSGIIPHLAFDNGTAKKRQKSVCSYYPVLLLLSQTFARRFFFSSRKALIDNARFPQTNAKNAELCSLSASEQKFTVATSLPDLVDSKKGAACLFVTQAS